MKSWSIATLSVVAAAWMAGAAAAQDLDPSLQDGWAFMQKEMPGVSKDLLEKACKDSQLVIYHGIWTPATKSAVDGFTKRFPCISVTRLELTTGARRERFASEFRNEKTVVDIVNDTDQTELNAQARKGMLMNYPISNDQAFKAESKNSGYWYPLMVIPVGIAYNSALVSEEDSKTLSSWQALGDSKWKDQLGFLDPTGGGTSFVPLYAMYKQCGADLFKKIAANKPRLYQSSDTASSSVASGDIGLAVVAETGIYPLWEAGAPVRWVIPNPAVTPATGQAISAKAPHPNAAKLYQEYSFTEEGYTLFQRFAGAAPARIGFAEQRKVGQEAWYKLPGDTLAIDEIDYLQSKPAIVEAFRSALNASR